VPIKDAAAKPAATFKKARERKTEWQTKKARAHRLLSLRGEKGKLQKKKDCKETRLEHVPTVGLLRKDDARLRESLSFWS